MGQAEWPARKGANAMPLSPHLERHFRSGTGSRRSAIQTVLIGGLAAAAAFGIATAIS